MPDKEDFRVGDSVIIKDNGETYDSYESWIILNIHNVSDVIRFRYGEVPRNGMTGKIVALAPHEDNKDEILAYIRADDGYYYLINVKGLEKSVEEFDVTFYYEGHYTTTVRATSKKEALQIAKEPWLEEVNFDLVRTEVE